MSIITPEYHLYEGAKGIRQHRLASFEIGSIMEITHLVTGECLSLGAFVPSAVMDE